MSPEWLAAPGRHLSSAVAIACPSQSSIIADSHYILESLLRRYIGVSGGVKATNAAQPLGYWAKICGVSLVS
jgi:hypothetical protein